MSVTDYEKSVLAGEIASLNAPLNRGEAIAKLKESKELLDLGVIEAADYETLKAELTPIIINYKYKKAYVTVMFSAFFYN